MQWQPFLCLWPLRMVGWNARGSLLWMALLVSSTFFLLLGVFPQSLHMQSPLQKRPPAKHSQYSLRHFDFLQLHLSPAQELLLLFPAVVAPPAALPALP